MASPVVVAAPAEAQPLWGPAGAATRRPLAEPRERRPAGRPVPDIAKAGRLLAAPPLPVLFQDEEDMRRVYALIYDVFRYKSVMDQALTDVSFFQLNPHLRAQRSQVWLLLFDLWQRDFKAREAGPQEALARAGLADAEAALWAANVRLAAALARMRIKHRAPRLELLLPPHLRDHRVVAVDSVFVSAWLNPFRTRDKVPLQLLEEVGLHPLALGDCQLTSDTFMADAACPRVILFHPDRRADLAQSRVVRDHQLILQERTFCLGPAAMARALRELELRGCVAQTHVNSARSTAYLAALLSDDDTIHKLLAFGAGDRKEEYESYLRALGVQNVEVHAESFVEAAAQHTAAARAAEEDADVATAVSEDTGDNVTAGESGEEMWTASGDEGPLSSVVAVLATPPSTYTGVADPVELACSRGGDLTVLQLLTDTDAGGGRGRVAAILDEQRQTLLRAMSRPQIQVVLYETHSVVAAENSDMVSRLVREVNLAALERHAEERGRPLQPGHPPPDHLFHDLQVPPCDLFEVGKLPCMGPNGEDHQNFEDEGCYLAVLQRKEVVRLDNKYMINIAESRGLFGVPAGAKKSAAGRRRRDQASTSTSAAAASQGGSGKRRRSSAELERIAKPTRASLLRSAGAVEGDAAVCPRLEAHLRAWQGADARRWWREAAQHVASGRPGPLRLTRTRRRPHRPPLALPVTSLPSPDAADAASR